MSSRAVRSSTRLAKSAAGATVSAPEVQSDRVQSETGQALDEIDQANLEIAIAEGNTQLVVENHWAHKLSYEMKGVANKLEAFSDKIKAKGLKAEFDDILEEFKDAAAKEREDGPSSSTDASTDKHERMVAQKGANAHLAAVTKGMSILEADAEMAVAMGKLEGKHAEVIAAKIKELESLQAQALRNQASAHKKEVTSKVKHASEEATKAAEERFTRKRGEAAIVAANDAAMVAEAFNSPAPTTGSGGTVPASPAEALPSLSKAAAGGMLGKQLKSLGIDVEVDKTAKKGSKRKADDPVVSDKPKSKAKAPKLNEDGSEMTKADEERGRRESAAKHYKLLGIKGPAGLDTVVEELTALRKVGESVKALKTKLDKREQQKADSILERKKINRRLKKAIKILRDSEWTDENFIEEGLMSEEEEKDDTGAN